MQAAVIKMFGILLVTLCPILFGFFKSFMLTMRCRKLFGFCEGLDTLGGCIKNGSCELKNALKKSFGKCDFIKIDKTKAFCSDCDLSAQDIQIINDFLSALGRGTREYEYNRILCFKSDIQKIARQLENEQKASCRLWQTGGICIGLTLGILLI